MNKVKLENALNLCDKISMWLNINFGIILVILFFIKIDGYQTYMIYCCIPIALGVIYTVISAILDRMFLGGE